MSKFSKAQVDAAYYHPVSRRSVLAWRVRVGFLNPNSDVLVDGEAERFVPPEQRFFAGGPNTVRGFSSNLLGPVVYVIDDVSLEESQQEGELKPRAAPVGGEAILLGNLEYRFPSPLYPSRIRFGLFVDVGQVWKSDDVIRLRNLRITPGVGVRFTTPLGPARLDIAWNPYDLERGPLYVRTGDRLIEAGTFQQSAGSSFLDQLTFNFAIGHAF